MVEWETLEAPDGLGLSRCAGAVRIEFCRPEVLNAFDSPMARELLRIVEELGRDDAVRSLLLTGRGRAFSAGADISTQFGDAESRSVIERELREITNPTVLTLRDIGKPVVAAVNGPAAGVGCSIALAADLVLAARSSFFLLAFANIGLTTDGGASLIVPARVGLGRAMVMSLLAERIHADQAVAWGLADKLVEDEDLPETSAELAVRLAAGPTRSYAATKRAINGAVLANLAAALDTEAGLQGEMSATEDFLEGCAAFTAKRPARFTGR